jgi:hypothetical protein
MKAMLMLGERLWVQEVAAKDTVSIFSVKLPVVLEDAGSELVAEDSRRRMA